MTKSTTTAAAHELRGNAGQPGQDPQAQLRRAYVRATREHRALEALWRAARPADWFRHLPRFDLTPYLHLCCGARNRAGAPCGQPFDALSWRNGRCKFHGGKSTGPRTAAGRAASAMNGNAPKRPRSASPGRAGSKPHGAPDES